ncbi:hypothetical protein F5Y10DRAFT_168888 [Nemania abortiva]|nr:hypothetical protein F5Y10DRAFT_168888 [Nemania abortiva]
MIRQPLSSAIGRSRAELSRVTDGIAASLRAFSTAQQLSQDSSNDGNTPRRQRAAAAFSDLMELNKGNSPRPSSQSNTTFRKLDLRSESAPIAVPSAASAGGPNIIRGGFRGRGGFSRGGTMSRGGMMGPGRRGGGRPRSDRGGEGGRGRRRNRKQDDDQGATVEESWSPEVVAMREAKEIGSLHQFDPSVSKSDLVGWGPAVPTDKSVFAKENTVLRQARILGGGEGFHPLHTLRSQDLWKRYKEDTGVFFPSEEAKKWSVEVMGLESLPPVPKETKDAVLQDALLGMYQGPQYADIADPLLADTLGTVRSYVRRDGTWNSDASRRIEEKVRSLLPATATSGARASA